MEKKVKKRIWCVKFNCAPIDDGLNIFHVEAENIEDVIKKLRENKTTKSWVKDHLILKIHHVANVDVS